VLRAVCSSSSNATSSGSKFIWTIHLDRPEMRDEGDEIEEMGKELFTSVGTKQEKG
jgi:hypothetical protein